MVVRTNDSEGAVAFSVSTRGILSHTLVLILIWWTSLEHPKHPPFDATDGHCREEAIMILRRFYVTENTNGILVFTIF
jgi:hypothetical protein